MSAAPTPEASGTPDWAVLTAHLQPLLRARLPCEADADDVMQDVMLRVMTSLPQLADETRITAWMGQIARNAISDFYRRRQSLQAHSLTESSQAAEPVEIGEEESRQSIERALGRYVRNVAEHLPEPYREAIRMTELEGQTQKAAALASGVPLSTMKSRVQRGRAQIRAELDACCRVELDARNRVMSCEPHTEPCGGGRSCDAESSAGTREA